MTESNPGPGAPATVDDVSPTQRKSTIRRAAVGIILAQLIVRTAVFGAGFFYGDDYILQGRAALYPLFSEEFLLYNHAGHIMPAGYLLSGIIERVAPLNYWAILVVLLALQAVATWLSYLLFHRLFGDSSATIVALLVTAFSPLTLLPYAWWSAAVLLIPLQIFGALTGLCLLRRAQGGGTWNLVGAAAATMAGVVFSEKGALIPITALGILFAAGPPRAGLVKSARSALRSSWLYWLITVPLLALYSAFYLDTISERVTSLFDSANAITTATTAVIRGWVPAVIGGPLSWSPDDAGSAIADSPWLWTFLSLTVLAVLIAVGVIRKGSARNVWIMTGAYLAVDVLALVLGRNITGLDRLGLGLRYTADSIILVSIAIACSVRAATPLLTALSRSSSNAAALRWLQSAASRKALIAAGGVVFLCASLTSSVALIEPLMANASRPWLVNIQRATEMSKGQIHILDGPVPASVYLVWNPFADYSTVLAPWNSKIVVTDAITEPVMFDESGNLVTAQVGGIPSPTGPTDGCGWFVEQSEVEIPLEVPTAPWIYSVQIDYLSAYNTKLPVGLESGEAVSAPFREGLGTTILSLEGGGSYLRVGPNEGPGGVCVSRVVVGVLEPAP